MLTVAKLVYVSVMRRHVIKSDSTYIYLNNFLSAKSDKIVNIQHACSQDVGKHSGFEAESRGPASGHLLFCL